jgi:hypothetical protein
MNTTKSPDEFLKGLQNIERAIIDGVRAAGRDIDARNVTWHRGKELVPPPMAVELELRAGKNTIADSFSSEEVKDSWERVTRPDTWQKILRIIAAAHR